MSDHLRKSIDELENKLHSLQADCIETMKAINMLHKMLGNNPPYGLSDEPMLDNRSIRPDQFFGKALATAVGEYLQLVGYACLVSEIMEGLRRGGYDWGGAKFPERVLRINLAKNTAKFVQIKGSDSFGLLQWYPDVKRAVKMQSDEGADPEVGVEELSMHSDTESTTDEKSGSEEESGRS